MNVDGFVAEDDLILYAMHALPESEMEQIARRIRREPAIAQRLAEIQTVLGVYAVAATELQEVPSSALSRLQQSVERERSREAVPSVVAASRATKSEERSSRWSWNFGLLWAGWALAALLLVSVGVLYRQNHVAEPEVASTRQSAAPQGAALREAQTQTAALQAERDRLQHSLQQKDEQLQASVSEAAKAKSRSEMLTSKLAESSLRVQQEAERANALTASVSQNEAERKQLGEALTREQQLAASAAESQQVLAALSDPTALHVTLTEPKQKKRPSGRGTYLASNGTLVFTGSDLESLPADKVYELWLLPKDGTAPVPAGTFRPDSTGNATVIASHFKQVSAAGFAITVENAGGSTTPTMPIRLVGTT